ncbi:MAG: hypothetical protein JWQ02_3867 [Capsulimonas sp.]|jgi:uncharacterized protein YwqG|nr:hypothetical protein [Capsulimonas sp.]
MEAVAEVGLSAYTAEIEAQILPSIRIAYPEIAADASGLGQSRIGGLPDLPADIKWPTASGYNQSHIDRADPLLFLAQINLADIAEYDPDSLLPHSGLLLFFAANWVNVVSEYRLSDGLWKVIYVEDITTLKPAFAPELPEGLLEDEDYSQKAPKGHMFRPSAIEFSVEMTIPQAFEHPAVQLIRSTDEGDEAFWNLKELLYPGREDDIPSSHPPIHRMLGHSQLDQVCFLRWDLILLLQLGSEIRIPKPSDATNIYWEFGGTGCFFIRPDDLRARNFSEAELIYEAD